MHRILISTIALASGLTLSASGGFAQSQSGPSNPQGGAATSSTQQQNVTRPPAAMTQDRLRQVLSQAGFQDVKIVDASYLVQARTKEGDAVLMLINPPDASRTTSASASSSTSSPGSTGSTSSQSSTSK